MKKGIVLALLVVVAASQAWASHASIIGGFRSGLALGIQAEQKLADRLEANFAMETTTGEDMSFVGDNPFLLFGGLKYGLGSLATSPVFFCLGALGKYGTGTQYGGYASLTFENLYQNPALYFDLGCDIFGSRAQGFAQLGYKIIAEPASL